MTQTKFQSPSRRDFIGTTSALALTGALAGMSGVVWADDSKIGFSELYKKIGPQGLEYSDKLLALSGKKIQILGYMAPPLKPDANFLVLTRAPVALCPYCNTDEDWPSDIVVIYMKDQIAYSEGAPMAVAGTLELGSKTDDATGFVSLVRLVDATAKTL